MHVYRGLAGDYERRFDLLLKAVGSATRGRPVDLTAFWSMCGHRYDGQLMVVGRAVNGWANRWNPAYAAEASARAMIISKARASSESEKKCPMLWVTEQAGSLTEYNTNRSAFWRVIRRVLAGVKGWRSEPADWSSYLCWTNLLNVAPWDGGNPTGPLWDVQLEISKQLLVQEVRTFQPKRVLVLAGWPWFAPFVDGLRLKVDQRRGAVEGVATEAGRRWVIAKHPERKPEDRAVRDILAAFE